MEAAGLELQTLVTFKMDSAGLKIAEAAAAEAAAAAAPAKGKPPPPKAAPPPEPAEAEEGANDEPTQLPTPALTEALSAVVGKEGTGFQARAPWQTHGFRLGSLHASPSCFWARAAWSSRSARAAVRCSSH